MLFHHSHILASLRALCSAWTRGSQSALTWPARTIFAEVPGLPLLCLAPFTDAVPPRRLFCSFNYVFLFCNGTCHTPRIQSRFCCGSTCKSQTQNRMDHSRASRILSDVLPGSRTCQWESDKSPQTTQLLTSKNFSSVLFKRSCACEEIAPCVLRAMFSSASRIRWHWRGHIERLAEFS
ncbi:hypothetical protein B0H15DRAFT_67473 [Mycena belliarum]|uniref:Secreted protein n=1 Tax=Mycena belliarum TaxID=1033014 RepID=A0AAD6U915_9AGAR|nr:hypothetical protein B0H15DRAFT_67473 [Mycena belliae]